MAKATGFKFGTLIDQFHTNQKTNVYPYNGRCVSHIKVFVPLNIFETVDARHVNSGTHIEHDLS